MEAALDKSSIKYNAMQKDLGATDKKMSDLNFEKYQREQKFAADDEKATASALEKAGEAKERWEKAIEAIGAEHNAEQDADRKKALGEQMEALKERKGKQEKNITALGERKEKLI